MKTELIKLALILTGEGTQIRASLNTETISEYAEAMVNGAKFPPAVVFKAGKNFILADGFHRIAAAASNQFKDFECDVRQGGRADALRFALAANAAHGLKRTNADKRRSVELALAEWPKLSSAEIARICAVGHTLVDDVRREIQPASDAGSRTGADGKTRSLPKKERAPRSGDTSDAGIAATAEKVSESLTPEAKADIQAETAGRQWFAEQAGELAGRIISKASDEQLAAALMEWEIALRKLREEKKRRRLQ